MPWVDDNKNGEYLNLLVEKGTGKMGEKNNSNNKMESITIVNFLRETLI